MSIVTKKIEEGQSRPYYEILVGAFAFVLAFASSLASANPNYESGMNDPGYYLRTGTVFFVPLTIVALIVLALGTTMRKKPATGHVVKAVGYLIEILAFASYGAMSLVHYAARPETAKNVYFLASIVAAIPYLYLFAAELLDYVGSDVLKGRKDTMTSLIPSFLGAAGFLYVLGNYLYPDLHQVEDMGNPEVGYGLHFCLLLIGMAVAILSGPVGHLAAKKLYPGERSGKSDMLSGVLLAISGLVLFIDAFLIDSSGLFLYELYYVSLALGCAILLMGACLASYGELASRIKAGGDEAEEENAEEKK